MAIRSNGFKVSTVVTGCATGLFLAVAMTAPYAAADPVDPVSPAPTPAAQVQALDTEFPAPPPDGTPHLASPDALPPGSTMDPSVKGDETPNVSYLKDLFHAVQDHEIGGKEALMMGLAQRGMNTPYPDQAPGPNRPTSPGDSDSVLATPPTSPDALAP